MKKTIFLLGLATILCLSSQAQTIRGILRGTRTNTNQSTSTRSGSSNGGSFSNLSNTEIVSALRQALEIGSKNAGSRLSVKDGFFGNNLVKILLPPELLKVEGAMRQFGLGSLADELILQMNRAAEDAAGQAAPIFVNAITSMSIQDGLGILKGGNGAATNYLKSKTTASLTTAFRPVIKNSLNKFNVDQYWNQLITSYNRLPIARKKINPDLTAYVTEKALNGLFVTVADEENKIRTNPGARITELLQKVFGAK